MNSDYNFCNESTFIVARGEILIQNFPRHFPSLKFHYICLFCPSLPVMFRGSNERIRKYQHHRGWHAQKHHGSLFLNVHVTCLTAAFWFSWFLHLSFCSTDSCDVYAETNKDVIVPLGIPPEEKGQLQWKLNEQIVFHRRLGKLIIGSDGDVTADGSLKLTKVSKDKAGTYTPGVFSADGKLVGGLKNIKLCVIGRFLLFYFPSLCHPWVGNKSLHLSADMSVNY